MTPPIDGLEINEGNASQILRKDEFKDLTAKELEILLKAKQEESETSKEREEEKKESNLSPFPKHKGYSRLWKQLSPGGKQEMKENIRISKDGKIETIKIKKKFSMLTAKHNGKDIFDGSHKDQYGSTGIKGVTYLGGEVAERECKNQGKKLFNNKTEANQFINFFPGKSFKEKIFNFMQLFGLEKAGYWGPAHHRWSEVGSTGYARLSKIDQDIYVCGAGYFDDDPGADRDTRCFPVPFIVFEDC